LAISCKKRHQIVRNFLVALGVDEETAEQDAEGVEHHVSLQTLDCFKAFLKK
jgi:DtxR family manganese transport transcriptional regulator